MGAPAVVEAPPGVGPPRRRGRRIAARVVFVVVVAAQLALLVRGYEHDPHHVLAFQMFDESSDWRADIVRVTTDGRRIPIDEPWPGGYQWAALVPERGLAYPGYEHHADAGVDNTLAFLEAALDWVAANTPADRETAHLEARVTYDRNTHGPTTVVLRSPDRPAARVSALVGRVRRVDAAFDATGSVRAWALLRLTIAPLVFIHLRPFLRLMDADTWYRDRFHESWVSWYPEVGKGTYFWLLRLCLVTAVLASLGIATRVTTIATALFVAWNLFLTTTNYHHNRAFLALILAGIATAPSGRVLSVDAWLARRRGRPLVDDAPRWPLWLLRFEIACVYGGSGLSKLFDDDWRGGIVTWDRVLKSRSQLDRSPLPQWFIEAISQRGFHTGFAKVVILTELFIALGLWFGPTRLTAVWTAVWFHVFIEIAAHVQVFSYAGIAALVIWAVPRTRDRVVVRAGPRLATAVRWLDWLARFRVEPRPADGPVALVDRDGRTYEGPAAVWRVLARLPLTFMVAGPVVAGSSRKRSLTAERPRPQTEHSSVNLVQ